MEMDKTTLRKRSNYDDMLESLKQPKVLNDKLQDAIKNNLNYYETLQKKLDVHQTKAASIQIRKQWLQRQKISKYQNEYDRIRGLISQNIVKHGPNSVEALKERAKKVKGLGAITIDSIV